MREKERRHQAQELDSLIGRSIRYWLRTIYRRSRLEITSYFYFNDWDPRFGIPAITFKELTHRLTIIFISAGVTGIGIGQILALAFFR